MTTSHSTQRWNRGIAAALIVALIGCLGYAALCWVAFSQGNQAIGHGFISDGATYRRRDVLYAYWLGVGRSSGPSTG